MLDYNIMMTEKKKSYDTIDKLKLEHAIEIENKQQDIVYDSRCGPIDKRLLKFVSQSVMSVMVASLCIYKLALDDLDCDSTNLYSSILTGLLGMWMTSPTIK